MKTISVIPGRNKVGSMTFATEESQSLIDRGLDVQIFRIYGGLSIFNFFRDLFSLRGKVKTFAPQLLHAHFGTITCVLTLLAARGRPVVVTFRGSDLQPSKYDGVLRNIGQLLLSYVGAFFASHVICVSRQLTKKIWFRKTSISVIPSSLNLDLFKPIDIAHARETLNWSKSSNVVLFYANAKLKRLDLARKVIDNLINKIPQLELVVIEGGVVLEDMPIYLNASDILLFLSDNEGSPNLIREACACNLPVVSFNVGDVAEQLEGVHPSFICGRDLAEVEQAILKIFEQKQRSNGHKMMWRYSKEVVIPNLIQIYKEILKVK